MRAGIALEGCGAVTGTRTFQYTGGSEGLRPVTREMPLEQVLPPYSFTVVELELGAAAE